MTETLSGIAFAVLAIASLGGAAAMVSARNVVHAAFWLLEVSVAAAGLYWFLGAEYIAIIQLLVYAGAVAILLIFTIMITLRRREDAIRPRDFSWLALVLSVSFFALVALALGGWDRQPVKLPAHAPALVDFGALMFSPTGWALPFEIASLVLTAALVAAIWWSREEDE